MNSANPGVIESDAAVRVPAEGDHFIVYGERRYGDVGFVAFHEAQSAISSYFRSIGHGLNSRYSRVPVGCAEGVARNGDALGELSSRARDDT